MGKFLSDLPDDAKNKYAMVGFRIGNTLSENGTVARGICSTDAQGHLPPLLSAQRLSVMTVRVQYLDENDQWVTVDDNTPVSMNVWGFHS